jgi:hypothetical protein
MSFGGLVGDEAVFSLQQWSMQSVHTPTLQAVSARTKHHSTLTVLPNRRVKKLVRT